jgi:hypothetical protein
MKKGLLSLLVIALTVVGCQNYDDQFDSLNDKIASLNTEISSLKAIQTTVTALGTKLDALQGSALSDDDLDAILKEVADVEASVALLDLTTIEGEVDELDDEVKLILSKLGDLLAANAFFEGNLTITNLGQLANAHELIKTGADDPTITVKGHVRVIVGTALKDSIASVNLILAKLRSIQGTATITSEVDAPLPALTYVTGDVFLNGQSGKAAIAADKLLTVDGNLHLIGLTGAIAFPALGSVGTVAITEVAGKATVTSVNISGMTAGTVQTAAGVLNLPAATTISLGGTLPALVTAAKCTAFTLTTGGTQGSLEMLLGGTAATLSIGVTKLTGTTSITTKGNIDLPNVTSVETMTLTFSTAASTLKLPAVTKITGAAFTTNDKCTEVDISALTTLTATTTLPGVAGLTLTALVSQTIPIVAVKATVFDAPALSVKEGLIDLKDGSDLTVHLGSLVHTATYSDLIPDAARVKTLKLMAQDNGSVLSVATFTILADLTYAGVQAKTPAADAQNNTLSMTASNTKLTTLAISGYLGSLTVSATPLLTSLDTTGGYIVDTQVDGNPKLTSFIFAHTHVQKDNASSVAIRNNPLITAVDMSSLPKVQTVTITGNAKLTSIVAPSASVLATSNATITVRISGNKLSGTYTAATAPSGTVSYTAATIVSAELSSFKTWIEANRVVDLNGGPSGDGTLDRTLAKLDGSSTAPALGSGVTGNSITYNIDIDDVDAATGSQALSAKFDADVAVQKGADGNAATADDDSDNATSAASGVSTHNELQLVTQ